MSLPANPSSRHENYLAAIVGAQQTYPANPSSRLERYLDYIASTFIGKYYTKTEVETLINTMHDPIIVATLPTASATTRGRIYMVGPKGSESNIYYEEYMTVRTGSEGAYTYTWELLGTTSGINVTDLAGKMEGDSFITVDENSGGTKVAISMDSTIKPWRVTLTGTSGELTTEEFAKLNVSNRSEIVLNGNIYKKASVQNGYIAFISTIISGEHAASLYGIAVNTNTASEDYMTWFSGSFSLMENAPVQAVQVLTTAPTADNPNGYKFVYLTNEPDTKYDGYIYLIRKQGYN